MTEDQKEHLRKLWTPERRAAMSERMKNNWTPERKAKQSEAIKSWKSWENSSGPKSDEGKKKSATNSIKHGLFAKDFKSLKAAHSKLSKLLKEYEV